MRLVLLGTTGYHPNDLRHTPTLVLPELGLVFDAGTSMYRLKEYLATDELDIFLSHAHLDHVVGLTFLLDVFQGRVMRRLTIHGEAEKLAAVKEHLFNELLFPVKPLGEFRPLAGPVELPQGGRLTWFPVEHPGGAVGFRLDWPERSFAYVTDTTAAPGADYIEKIRGVDLLVHECYFSDGYQELAQLTGHSCASAVGRVAAEARVGRMILVHLNPLSTDPDPIGLDKVQAIFPATSLGYDRMEVEF